MTTTYKKKLIEVAIPLEAINEASIKEKSNPFLKGHPRSLHQWWARRPLPSCRAVLFAQLVDDPSSHPDQFPTQEEQEVERLRLFAIIEDLVKWENSTNEEVLERARSEIRRSCGELMPSVYDPFSGGGSIPFEAQRLGLQAYGSDLNPVAVMIGKAMVEFPAKFKNGKPVHPGIKKRSLYACADGLVEDVQYYGGWMRQEAEKRIDYLYPPVNLPKEYGGGKARALAYIWARTVPSPDPAYSDVNIPLVSTFVLNSKKGQEVWIEPIVDKQSKQISYIIRHGATKSQIELASSGTSAGKRQAFRCILSDAAITYDYIREMGKAKKIGRTLIAIVAEAKRGRAYLTAASDQISIADAAIPDWRPGARLPENPRDFKTPNYGMETFGELFTDRQLVALNTLSSLVTEVRKKIELDGVNSGLTSDNVSVSADGCGAKAYAEAVSVYLAFAVDKLADYCNSLCSWNPVNQNITHLFNKHAIPMLWDYAEVNPFASMMDFEKICASSISGLATTTQADVGKIFHLDAIDDYPIDGEVVISSDPPYYDNIGYADISDFFYVWMRRSLQDVYPSVFGSIVTPKTGELVATPYRHGGKVDAEHFFLTGMTNALSNMVRRQRKEFPATIYYAFKQSEISAEGISSTGWATFLGAVIDSGFAIVGTWPIRTERSTRMIASGTNALANSVVLVCRKKEASAEVITRAEFIRALKLELPPAIAELQAANIAPADMPQSAIGPGMGVFSRYKAVLESDDSTMSVKSALQLINRELDEYLGGIQGEFDADTRFAITWFELNGMKAGEYGTANNIATAKGISVASVQHAGIVESSAGKVRILKRDEIDPNWQPEVDKHLTVWECCQHLVRLHEKHGIGLDTAVMLRKIGAKADDVRDLAYVLYNICEKRGDAKEATAYNALIADWTDLTREAAAAPLSMKSGQMKFYV